MGASEPDTASVAAADPPIDAAMQRAIDLSLHAGDTAGNPRVGAVVLDSLGTEVGAAYHARAGGDHAEVAALRIAGERARGGTAVITLEPCNHQGATPPCTAALLQAGIGTVVYAVADPEHPGGGADLAAAGVRVESGVRAHHARRANIEWLTAQHRGRVHVTYKAAVSIDGRVAAWDGTSQWISNAESRADARLLRRSADTIIVGAGTVRADDPQLTRRDETGPTTDQPLRVVVDSSDRTPPDSKVRNSDAPTLVATDARFGAGPDGVDVVRLSRELFQAGRRNALLEGGSALAASFLRRDLVDRLIVYLAPTVLGAGPPLSTGLGIATLTDATRWHLDDVRRLGDDARLTYSRH